MFRPLRPRRSRSAGRPRRPRSGDAPDAGLVACGPGYPLPPDQFAASPFGRWQASVETMLATLAREDDAQERRIAALEKTADSTRRAGRTARALARAVGEIVRGAAPIGRLARA